MPAKRPVDAAAAFRNEYMLRGEFERAFRYTQRTLAERGPMGVILSVDGLTETPGQVTEAAKVNLLVLHALTERLKAQGGRVALRAENQANQALVDFVMEGELATGFVPETALSGIPVARLIPKGAIQPGSNLGAYTVYEPTNAEGMTPVAESLLIAFGQADLAGRMRLDPAAAPNNTIVDLVAKGAGQKMDFVRRNLIAAAKGETDSGTLNNVNLLAIRITKIGLEAAINGARLMLRLIMTAA